MEYVALKMRASKISLNKRFLIVILFLFDTIIASPCDFDSKFGTDSKWNLCHCSKTSPISVAIFCKHQRWPMVPQLPAPLNTEGHHHSDNERLLDASSYFYVDSLNVIDSNLVYIHEDAFKNQPNLHKLDFSRNKIEKINANAFKGLELKLTHLVLNYNLLSHFPQKSTALLQQLQYLNLMHNAIDKLDSKTFQDARLRQLKYLHLDHNLLDRLPEGTFSQLNLKLLTLSDNRIREIHTNSLPTDLWYLSLKNNLLYFMPLEALQSSSTTLENLDFEGNNLTELHSTSSVKFARNITLNLAHNRITILDSDSLISFPFLKKLILAHNQLSFVRESTFKDVQYLEILDLSNNKLSHLPAMAFSTVFASVKELNLENNNFHISPPCLKVLTNLGILNLKSNKLLRLDEEKFDNMRLALKELSLSYNLMVKVPSRALTGAVNLKQLDLSRNDIELLNKWSFGQRDDPALSNLIQLNLAGNKLSLLAEKRAFANIQSLAYLDLSHNRIRDLSEDIFDLIPNIESLFLQNNQIDIFPAAAIRKLPRLRHLVLDHNLIIALPVGSFSSMKNLEHLSLKNNRIHAIIADSFPPADLRSLKSLKLSFNAITFLASKTFSNLPNLEFIELQGNNLQYLNTYSFHNLTNLRKLDLSMNKISRTFQLALFDLPRLQYLSLSSNSLPRIESGTFSDAPNLDHIDLSKNRFIRFESQYLYRLKSLKKLNLAGNYITSFELDAFKSTLVELDLSSNLLQQVDDRMFGDFYELKRLSLAENSLTDVHYKAFLTDKQLTEINLSRNELTFIRKMTFSGQKMLERLDLSQNSLRKVDPIAFGQDNLNVLELSSNKLQGIPYQALELVRSSLSSLDLSDNQIISLESKYFVGLKNLTKVMLSFNRIQRIEEASFKGLPNLRYLRLDHNPVTDWHPNAFKEISSYIEHINLASTGLASLPILGHRSLKWLNLSHNTLYDLDEHSMMQFPKLELFDVSNNRLSYVSKSILNDLAYLKTLNISRNPVASIDSQFFQNLHKLEVLSMHHMSNLIRFNVKSLMVLRNLKELSFYGFPELEDRYNVTVLLNDLPPLQVLRIEIHDSTLKNQLSLVDTRFLRSLFIEGGRRMTSIEPEAFENLRGYSIQISIRNTGLKTFHKKALQTLSHVTHLELDLSQNQLESLHLFDSYDPPLLNSRGTILSDVWLDGNMLICDCRLAWVKRWLKYLVERTSQGYAKWKLERWNKTLCSYPAKLKNVPVIYVDYQSLGCSSAAEKFRRICWSLTIFLVTVIHFSRSS